MDINSLIEIAQKLEGLSWPVLIMVALLVVGRYAGPSPQAIIIE